MTDPLVVLAVQMDPLENDAGASSVREYLVTLLATLWYEQEGFGGKRPFGNSSWDYEIYKPLIREGLMDGSFDEDGYVEEIDTKTGHKLVAQAIQALNVSPPGPPVTLAVAAGAQPELDI